MTDTVSRWGRRPGRCVSVLEFCLVFCTVSALTQSSLWLLHFAFELIVLPCPIPPMQPWLWPWSWVSGRSPSAGHPGASPGARTAVGAPSPLVVLGAGRGWWGWGQPLGCSGFGGGPDPFPFNGRNLQSTSSHPSPSHLLLRFPSDGLFLWKYLDAGGRRPMAH